MWSARGWSGTWTCGGTARCRTRALGSASSASSCACARELGIAFVVWRAKWGVRLSSGARIGVCMCRMVTDRRYVTGMENIRDVIPFPRWPGHAEG